MAKKMIHLLFCFFVLAAAAKDDKEFPAIYGFPVVSARETVYGPQISCWTVNENLYGIQISPVLGLSVDAGDAFPQEEPLTRETGAAFFAAQTYVGRRGGR